MVAPAPLVIDKLPPVFIISPDKVISPVDEISVEPFWLKIFDDNVNKSVPDWVMIIFPVVSATPLLFSTLSEFIVSVPELFTTDKLPPSFIKLPPMVAPAPLVIDKFPPVFVISPVWEYTAFERIIVLPFCVNKPFVTDTEPFDLISVKPLVKPWLIIRRLSICDMVEPFKL